MVFRDYGLATYDLVMSSWIKGGSGAQGNEATCLRSGNCQQQSGLQLTSVALGEAGCQGSWASVWAQQSSVSLY